MINATSNVSYWWKCKLGHLYKAAPANKLSNGHGCPICSGHKVLAGFNDLQTKCPDLVREWDYERNKPLLPSEISPGTQRKVWWICPKGHSYSAQVLNRTSAKTSCPICSGRMALDGYNDTFTTHPEARFFWDFDKNKKIKPTELTYGSTKSVW